jgi:hypothetical protein
LACTKGGIASGVDFNNKGREKQVHTQVVHANEAAPMLALVGVEAV